MHSAQELQKRPIPVAFRNERQALCLRWRRMSIEGFIMRQFRLPLWALVLILPLTAAAAPLSGTISGTVKDDAGKPLVGALINVYDAITSKEVLKTARTDKQGRFLAANLIPGHYVLRAMAEGYKSQLVTAARVIPSQTSFFNFTLKRVSEMMSVQDELESYHRVLRRNRHVFQFDHGEPLEDEEEPFISKPHGIVSFYATQEFSSSPSATTNAGIDFAVTQMLTPDLEMVIAGQGGIGPYSRQRIETQTTITSIDDHKLSFTFGYSHLPLRASIEDLGRESLKQYQISLLDRWSIADPLVILYGVDITKFEGAYRDTQVTPRLGIDLQVTGRDRLYAALFSPTSDYLKDSNDFETSTVEFTEPILLEIDSYVPVGRRRYEVGYVHRFASQAQLETAIFYDSFLNRNTGVLSTSLDTDQAVEQRGSAHGVRVIFSRPISENISASVGYAVGQGQQFEPAQKRFSVGYFQVFSGRLNAQFIRTGTKISAIFRVSGRNAFFAIDPFQQKLRALDPSLNVYLTQQLPMFGFIPGRWEAILDVRNLLDSHIDDSPRLVYGQWRSVRGGFTVRF